MISQEKNLTALHICPIGSVCRAYHELIQTCPKGASVSAVRGMLQRRHSVFVGKKGGTV